MRYWRLDRHVSLGNARDQRLPVRADLDLVREADEMRRLIGYHHRIADHLIRERFGRIADPVARDHLDQGTAVRDLRGVPDRMVLSRVLPDSGGAAGVAGAAAGAAVDF